MCEVVFNHENSNSNWIVLTCMLLLRSMKIDILSNTLYWLYTIVYSKIQFTQHYYEAFLFTEFTKRSIRK